MSGHDEADAERVAFATHVLSAQRDGDLGEGPGQRRAEIVFGIDEDGALYSFVADHVGVTIRVSERGSVEVSSIIWIPDVLFGPLRRAMVASQELDGGGK